MAVRSIEMDLSVNDNDVLDTLKSFQDAADAVTNSLADVGEEIDNLFSGIGLGPADVRNFTAAFGGFGVTPQTPGQAPRQEESEGFDIAKFQEIFTFLGTLMAGFTGLDIPAQEGRMTESQRLNVMAAISPGEELELDANISLGTSLDDIHAQFTTFTDELTSDMSNWARTLPETLETIMEAIPAVNLNTRLNIIYPDGRDSYLINAELNLGERAVRGGLGGHTRPRDPTDEAVNRFIGEATLGTVATAPSIELLESIRNLRIATENIRLETVEYVPGRTLIEQINARERDPQLNVQNIMAGALLRITEKLGPGYEGEQVGDPTPLGLERFITETFNAAGESMGLRVSRAFEREHEIGSRQNLPQMNEIRERFTRPLTNQEQRALIAGMMTEGVARDATTEAGERPNLTFEVNFTAENTDAFRNAVTRIINETMDPLNIQRVERGT